MFEIYLKFGPFEFFCRKSSDIIKLSKIVIGPNIFLDNLGSS